MTNASVVIRPQRREVIGLALGIQVASLITGVWLGLWHEHPHAAPLGTMTALFGISLGLFLIFYARKAFWSVIEVGESGMTCVRGRDPARVFEWSDFGRFSRSVHRIRLFDLYGEPILTIDGLSPRDVQALVEALRDHGVAEGAAIPSSGDEPG